MHASALHSSSFFKQQYLCYWLIRHIEHWSNLIINLAIQNIMLQCLDYLLSTVCTETAFTISTWISLPVWVSDSLQHRFKEQLRAQNRRMDSQLLLYILSCLISFLYCLYILSVLSFLISSYQSLQSNSLILFYLLMNIHFRYKQLGKHVYKRRAMRKFEIEFSWILETVAKYVNLFLLSYDVCWDHQWGICKCIFPLYILKKMIYKIWKMSTRLYHKQWMGVLVHNLQMKKKNSITNFQ